ncbi:hypothetical protein ABT58_16770 [Photobacterium aphoticum]|uniref:3'-5' exoribonuclease Rv2179c-like domain-containing protein n=1 Tax=Photobacterium aphoticum TaxID=754436 RepID=A0A0J1GIX5_9GAMM|nr:hypothetical protein ABT58_16770 [Photobacterium aphoticum]
MFFDSEFTALTQSARLLSLALVDENGRTFYAECMEAKTYTLDPWLQQHVLPHMQWLTQPDNQATFRHDALSTAQQSTWIFDTEPHIAAALTEWLSVYDDIEMWADCPAYDWVLFCQLFGGSLHLPAPLTYIVHDFSTLLTLQQIDPLTPRQQLLPAHSMMADAGQPHNALYDAQLLKACFTHWQTHGRFVSQCTVKKP